jgi:hypothetical protein
MLRFFSCKRESDSLASGTWYLAPFIVRLDRKFLLIAPTIVLACVVAGMIYATVQLRFLTDIGGTWNDRNEYVAAAERGEKPLSERQALNILRHSLDVEAKRTEAIRAEQSLLILLTGIAALCLGVLVIGVRGVPRESRV